MKKYLCFVFCVLSILHLADAQAAEKKQKIILGADVWCPFTCAEDDYRPGLLVEIAKEAFAKHGIEVEYRIIPWARAIDEARDGQIDGVLGASHGDAPDFIFPKTPQAISKYGIYAKEGTTWIYSGISSLGKVSLGVASEYSYTHDIDAYINAHKNEPKYVQPLSGDDILDMNIKKLLHGRITALLEETSVMEHNTSHFNKRLPIILVGSLAPEKNNELFIALTPKNPHAQKYADILDTEMKSMAASGRLKEITSANNAMGNPETQKHD